MSIITEYNEVLVKQVREGKLSIYNTDFDKTVKLMKHCFPETEIPSTIEMDKNYYHHVGQWNIWNGFHTAGQGSELFRWVKASDKPPVEDISVDIIGRSERGRVDIYTWDNFTHFHRPHIHEADELYEWLEPLPVSPSKPTSDGADIDGMLDWAENEGWVWNKSMWRKEGWRSRTSHDLADLYVRSQKDIISPPRGPNTECA